MDSGSFKQTPLTATGGGTTHPKRQNISFGRWAMPIMAQKLLDSDPLNRRRALQSLRDYVFDSKRIASKEFETSAAGRRVFEKHEFYHEILELVADEEESVRQEALTAIQRVCLSTVGAESMVKAGGIGKLIGRITHESDNALIPLLQALHFCCLVDPDKALEEKALETLVPLLKRPFPRVQEKTGTVIKDLTIEANGRKQALQLNVVPSLIELCLNEDDLVKAKSLAALMMITNEKDGKYEALENEVIKKVFPLLNCENVEVRLNATKVLTTVGEAPEGREILLQNYDAILDLLNDAYEEVQKAANKLIKIVNFKL